VSPEYLDILVGRVLRRALAKDETIEWADV
jgi:hypothetical protein